MNKYLQGKENARQEAMDWQLFSAETNHFWSELAGMCEHFYKLGKRYGLLKEFRENGIC